MSASEVYETVLKLIDEGKIIWPRNTQEHNQFITDNFGKVWDALLVINSDANIDIFSNLEKEVGISHAESTSDRAWEALANVLMLVILLEDSLGIDITPPLKYDEPDGFIAQKAKIRSRLKS